MEKVVINFSNKVFYTLLTIVGLALLSVGLYAYGTYAPATFGHSAGEIEGVCKTDGTGCDNVNDADSVVGNEYPLAGTGISVSDRTVNVDTAVIATRDYVDSQGGGTLNTRASCYWTGVVYTISQYCNTGYFVAGMNYLGYGGGYSGHQLYCCRLTLS